MDPNPPTNYTFIDVKERKNIVNVSAGPDDLIIVKYDVIRAHEHETPLKTEIGFWTDIHTYGFRIYEERNIVKEWNPPEQFSNWRIFIKNEDWYFGYVNFSVEVIYDYLNPSEPEPEPNTIGINIVPFLLGFMTIGIILIIKYYNERSLFFT